MADDDKRSICLTQYEFACLVAKMAKDIGSWGEQNLVWDREAAQNIHRLSARLAEVAQEYLGVEVTHGR